MLIVEIRFDLVGQSFFHRHVSLVPPNPESSKSPKSPPSAVLKARPILQGPTQGPVSSRPSRTGSGLEASADPVAQLTGSANPIVLKGNLADASRNLALGVIAVLAVIPIGAIAFWWAPKESFVAVATALLMGLLMFLALQFRLLLQKNGVFLLLSGGITLTLLVPIAVRLMATGSEWAQALAEFKRQQATGITADRSNLQAPAPSTVAKGESRGETVVASSKAETSGGAAPGNPAPQASAPAASVEGKKEAPSALATAAEAKTEVENPDEDPVSRATRLAKDEAIRRYPALQNTGTPEHAMYLEAYNELTRSRKFEFFKDAQWPLKIAEILAAREGWVRFDKRPVSGVEATKKASLPGSEINLQAVADSEKQAADVPSPAGTASGDPAADAVNAALKEARRRYPAVGQVGSPENKAYQEAYQDLDSRKTDFFDSPDWPIRLVELVAKQEGWKRVEGEHGGGKGTGPKVGVNREPALPQ